MGSISPMTPEWSRDLAQAVHSPLFEGVQGMRARMRFIQQATRYATLDDLPPRLKEVYRLAMAAYHDSSQP
jgi:hypothetical protein